MIVHKIGNLISFMTNNRVNLSPLTSHFHFPQLIYTSLIGISGALVFHEFFCPSVIRKYRELNMRGEKKLAEVIKYQTYDLFEKIAKTYAEKQTKAL